MASGNPANNAAAPSPGLPGLRFPVQFLLGATLNRLDVPEPTA